MDGTGVDIINKVFGITFDKINHTNYGDENELLYLDELEKEDEIIYVDFSPNEDAQKLIMESGSKCKIYDHHLSVKESIELWMNEYPYIEYNYSDTDSGTKIYYDNIKKEYEKNSCLEEYVNLVSIYDTYDKTNPYWDKSEELNRCFFKTLTYYKQGNEKYEQFIKTQVYKCEHYEHFEFTDWEKSKIIKDIEEEDKLFFDTINGGNSTMKTRKDRQGNYFVVVKLNKKASAIAHRLLDKYKKLSYVVVINTFVDNDWKVSVRSREGFNLLDYEMLKGHENASGVSSELCENIDQLSRDIWEGKKYCFEKKLLD